MILRTVAGLAFTISCLSLSAQEFASGPYLTLKRFVSAQATEDPAVETSSINLRVSSKLTDVKPGEIRLWLELNGNRTPIDVSDDGTVALPTLNNSDEAVAKVQSDQPVGSLVFTAAYDLQLRLPRGKRIDNALIIRYDDLFAPRKLLEDASIEAEKASHVQFDALNASQIDAVCFIWSQLEQPSRVAIRTGDETIDIQPTTSQDVTKADLKSLADQDAKDLQPMQGKVYRIPFDAFLVTEPSVVVLVPHTGWRCTLEKSPFQRSFTKNEQAVTPEQQ